MSFDNLHATLAQRAARTKVAVVGAAAPEVLKAALLSTEAKIASPILIGDEARMRRVADEEGIDLSAMEVLGVPDDQAGAVEAMRLVREGEVGALVKGRIPTWILMPEGLRNGLRIKNRLLSHVTLIEVPSFTKPILVTDSALTPYPTFDQKVSIVKNAVEVMRALGVKEPKTALLSASEEQNEKIPCSLEAARIADMNLPGGELENYGIIEGPLDLGCALSEETAKIKGVNGRVAGDVDILLAPDLVSANVLAKSLIYLASGAVAACVVGGTVPIAMVSRASPADDKLNAMALALSLANRKAS